MRSHRRDRFGRVEHAAAADPDDEIGTGGPGAIDALRDGGELRFARHAEGGEGHASPFQRFDHALTTLGRSPGDDQRMPAEAAVKSRSWPIEPAPNTTRVAVAKSNLKVPTFSSFR